MTEMRTRLRPVPKIGEILLRQGVVTEDELTVGLLLQHGTRKLIGEVLINMAYVTPQDLNYALVQQNQELYA
jgi:hypothetical protein